jgi:hypothetical protein
MEGLVDEEDEKPERKGMLPVVVAVARIAQMQSVPRGTSVVLLRGQGLIK